MGLGHPGLGSLGPAAGVHVPRLLRGLLRGLAGLGALVGVLPQEQNLLSLLEGLAIDARLGETLDEARVGLAQGIGREERLDLLEVVRADARPDLARVDALATRECALAAGAGLTLT